MRNNREASEVRNRSRLSRPLLQEESDQDGDVFHNSEDMIAREANFDASGTNFPYVYRSNTPREKRKSAEEGEGGFLIHDPVEDAKWKKLYEKTHVLLRPFVWLKRMKETLKDDFGSIALLLFLYLLQGIPLGLISAIPLILQSKEITYSQQAIFSFAHWPFSLKLLWAPIVDSLYVKKIGRRKSWMVPCQYLIGIFLLVVSYYVAEILGTNNGDGPKTPNVFLLMSIFLPLNFLAATQDIAVDGWALTMLSRKNVGYASTCNVVGQTVGFFMGNVVFLTLQSKDFANKWIRSVPSDKGLVEFRFLLGLGVRGLDNVGADFQTRNRPLATLQWIIGPRGESVQDDEELELGVTETYSILVRILCLKPMGIMVFVLLTAKIAFAATDSMTDLKLIAAGITTDKIASRSIFLTPLQVILPWLLGKQTAGPKPLNVFLWAYPYRIFMGIVFAALVYWTPSFREPNGEYPYLYYVIWIGAYYLQQISSYCIFLSMMAFNAQISDPKIGGTYMTLLNTLGNLGGNWPATLVLSVTDFFNRKKLLSSGLVTRRPTKNCVRRAVMFASLKSMGITFRRPSARSLVSFGTSSSTPEYSTSKKIPRNEWRVMKKGN
ncbi:hypothetical protein M3Y94_00918200 [Aphelenchoides besseyi]|nr:hypothetical protein M3Y94_00918200 [Aphelenchoides besseyi]